ncbi:MAG: VOC family protein [Thiolinea sp.]
MSNPVGWFEIYVQDMPRAKAFYEKVFQVSLSPLVGEMQEELEMCTFAMNDQGYGATGALVKMQGVPTGFAGTLVYFSCEDCAVEAKRAAEAGGKIFKDKFSIGEHGHIAMVHDTEGNTIGLHSMQ